jgi:hypothetical protein
MCLTASVIVGEAWAIWISWNLRRVCVSPARRFDDHSIIVKDVGASVYVGLEHALVELQMLLRMFALAVGQVGEPHGWRRSCRPRAGRRGHRSRAVRSWSCRCLSEHRYGRIVGAQLVRRHHMISHRIDQRRKQFAGRAHPSSQPGAVQIAAIAGHRSQTAGRAQLNFGRTCRIILKQARTRTFSLFVPNSICCSFSTSNTRRSISQARDVRSRCTAYAAP